MSVKQRLYPDKAQEHGLVTHCGQSRFVYNLGLTQRRLLTKDKRKQGVKISFSTQSKELSQLRKETDWLRAGSSVVQQGALRDLNRAFSNFFAGRAKYPVFKKKAGKQSFVVRDVSLVRFNKKNAGVLIPKIGYVKFRISVKWNELQQATSARVTRVNNKWFISFTTPPRDKKTTGQGVVGLDRGVAISVMTSDGQELHVPKATATQQRRYKNLQKVLARKQRTSKNRDKILSKMANSRFALANQKKDWLEKSTTQLAEQYELAVVEDLHVSAMTKRVPAKQDEDGTYLPNGQAAKKRLNRSILESLWSVFCTRLADKMDVVKCPAAYTSQRCSRCNHTAPDNRKSQAVFSCVACGFTTNADLNAAINIKNSVLQPTPREDFALCLNDGLEPVFRQQLTSC